MVEPPPTRPMQDGECQTVTYTPVRILGSGTFGTVYLVEVKETRDFLAIKSVRTMPVVSDVTGNADGFRNMDGSADREFLYLKELRGHPNIVSLRGAFISDRETEPKLNLVMDYITDTLHRVLKHYARQRRFMDIPLAKLYQYQLLRGLAFVHGKGMAHCDIKPQNLLISGVSHTLKICDFGCARHMDSKWMPPRSYLCSRYYRAPELILGCKDFTNGIDLWAAGCVYVEMLIGQPLFAGADGISQFEEMCKVMGTPTSNQLWAMNPNSLPDVSIQHPLAARPWAQVVPPQNAVGEDALDLIAHQLQFDPSARTPAIDCLRHHFFASLRKNPAERKHGLPDGIDEEIVGSLFAFLPDELKWCDAEQRKELIPEWCWDKCAQESSMGLSGAAPWMACAA